MINRVRKVLSAQLALKANHSSTYCVALKAKHNKLLIIFNIFSVIHFPSNGSSICLLRRARERYAITDCVAELDGDTLENALTFFGADPNRVVSKPNKKI